MRTRSKGLARTLVAWLGVFFAAYVGYAGVVVSLKIMGELVRSAMWLGPAVVAVMLVLVLAYIPSFMRGTQCAGGKRN